METRISHGFVLPDGDFIAWLRAAEPYTKRFERVAVVRSPAGNDLNRFRNITAVEAPGVWFQDNALRHIRRAYPNVVRVDVIRARTPGELTMVLNPRIQTGDRFGEGINGGSHIHDRFILKWPVEARPVRVVNAFNADLGDGARHAGIDIFAPPDTPVYAAAAGQVMTVVRQETIPGYGQYVQTVSNVRGVSYTVIYANLRDIRVNIGQRLNTGDEIGRAAGPQSIKIVVQRPGDGLSGYALPDVLNPADLIYWDGLRLRPLDNGLRIRERPGTDFKIQGQVNVIDELETLEAHGRTLQKLGVENQWIRIRRADGLEGYVAAWFVSVADPLDQLKFVGINLDVRHPLGKPHPSRLGQLEWIRIGYDVSRERGSTDLNAAFNLYKPVIEMYARAGKKLMLVLTHETYGEGRGYVWERMTTQLWRELTHRFADFCRQIAAQYAGKGLVHAYQIWNEQDTPPADARAAVPVPAMDYAHLLSETIRAIRTVDPMVTLLTGGHAGGPDRGPQYAETTLKHMPPGVRPDGIAFHPYGRGAQAGSDPYSPFGSIAFSVEKYLNVLPGRPVWITEWGVLNLQGQSHHIQPIAEYASAFLNVLHTRYPNRVAAALWFAWADSMDNGFGLVDANDRPKQPLAERYMQAATRINATPQK